MAEGGVELDARRVLLAVGMPAFEEPQRILLVLGDLLAQSERDLLVRVFDDSRSEDVAAAIASVGDVRLTYRRNDARLGLAENTQQAMRWAASAGHFGAVASDHDRLHHDWARRLIGVLQEEPWAVAAVCGTRRVDPSGEVLRVDRPPVIRGRRAVTRGVSMVRLPRVGDLVYGVFRPEVLAEVPFHRTRTPDRLFLVQAMSRGGIAAVPELLFDRVDQERRIEAGDLAARQRASIILPPVGRAPWWLRNGTLLLEGGIRRPRVTTAPFALVVSLAYVAPRVRRGVRRTRRRLGRSVRRGAVRLVRTVRPR